MTLALRFQHGSITRRERRSAMRFLYMHGYRPHPRGRDPDSSPWQSSILAAIAVLIAARRPELAPLGRGDADFGGFVDRVRLVAHRRTLRVSSERGWEPAPHAAISVVAELVTLGVFFAAVLRVRRSPGLW